jgi:hypothetical protein
MMLRRRLVPVAALVVAIGASAAGAATAAETGSRTTAGAAHEAHKPVACKVSLPAGVIKEGSDSAKPNLPGGGDAAIAAAKAAGQNADKTTDKGKPAPKGGAKPPVEECKKEVKVVSLDTIAAKLGVSKAALVQALDETKQWLISSTTKPSVGQFEQHLADLLHVPVAKVASVFGSELRIGGNPDA